MHELSIVMNIIEITKDQVIKNDGHQVKAIELDIGSLASIEMDAFHFAWDAALPGSILENSTLTINTIKAKAKCNPCQTEFLLNELYEACPECGSFRYDLLCGKELKISSLAIK